MRHHLAAALPLYGGRTSGSETYMSPFGNVQTSGGVYGRVNIRLGAFLALPVLVVLLVHGVLAAPVFIGAALTVATAAGSVTYRYARSHRS